MTPDPSRGQNLYHYLRPL